MFKIFKSIRLFITSSIFNVFFCVWTVVICSALSPFVILGSVKAAAKAGYWWACGVMFVLRWLCGIKVVVTGVKNLPHTRPFIVASKHQSALETVFFMQYFKDPIFVLKRELTRIPIYGWYLKAMKMISIDRFGGAAALKKMLKESSAMLKSGRIIVIFPEGRRVKVGEVADIQSGILAIHNSSPSTLVVPAFLNSGLRWPKGGWIKKPGFVTIHFAVPFSRQTRSKDELIEYISENINSMI